MYINDNKNYLIKSKSIWVIYLFIYIEWCNFELEIFRGEMRRWKM